MTNNELVEEFIQYTTYVRGTSLRSIAQYRMAAHAFMWHIRDIPFHAVVHADVDRFISALCCAPRRGWWTGINMLRAGPSVPVLSPKKIMNIVDRVKCIYAYLVATGHCACNPCWRSMRKPERRSFHRLSMDEIDVLMLLPPPHPLSYEDWRCALTLGRYTGARFRTIFDLDRSDIGVHHGVMCVRYRNVARHRAVASRCSIPLSDKAVCVMDNTLNRVKSGRLFPDVPRNLSPLNINDVSHDFLSRLLASWKETTQMFLPIHLSSTSIRHYCASQLHEHGISAAITEYIFRGNHGTARGPSMRSLVDAVSVIH